MAQEVRKTPGVYITEIDAFPRSIVGVETAVPAFIGYTEKAQVDGKSVKMRAIKISSLADYEAVFGKSFKPLFEVAEITDSTERPEFVVGDKNYKLKPGESGAARFFLYDSLRLFYANGGGTAYIVSVGDYGTESIEKQHFLDGLTVIADQIGPTMLVIPDAVLLPPDDPAKPYASAAYQDVARAMLAQCAKLQDRVAILDVYGTEMIGRPDVGMDDVIGRFRVDVGMANLNYGMAYFPNLNTSIVQTSEIDFTNLDLQDKDQQPLLKELFTTAIAALNLEPSRQATVSGYVDDIFRTDLKDDEIVRLNQNLSKALPLLAQIEKLIVQKKNKLPPSGAMAGVISYVDSTRGVWNAPANVVLTSVIGPTLRVNHDQQGELNMPLDGKAVNAIRDFVGRGTLVWGARTLDGNSNDWRYIQVRRTLVYVEQSIKNALDTFVFSANDAQTWVSVTSMISNFLQSLWSRGGLMGGSPAEAFGVACGLGSTMTPQDVLDGYMIVQVTLQMIRPAEFIELRFQQKMQGGA